SELSVSRTVPLPARVIAGPWSAGQHIILAADDGMVYAFDSSGELKWRVASADSRLTSASVTTNGNTLLVWENGRMMSINATGEVVRAVELNESIRHGAVLFGDYYAVGTLDGGIIFVEKDRL
ncbi:MAG TPA: PQQ-binding-like beta-propeller repeat protein, partial [Pirellulaceae bacterium]|nr:PQQ-binding-like beta-propeller repeat protein [Pirellulaceae bacterium]